MKYFKEKLYALFFWRTWIGELLSKVYDIYYHLKFCFNNDKLTDKSNLEFYLTKQYHIVEKGLALPEPRPGFGKEKIELLLDKGNDYIDKYGRSQLTSSIAQCLNSYLDFNDSISYHVDINYRNRIELFVKRNDCNYQGGVKDVVKKDIYELASMPFSDFVKSRYSIRNFSNEDVVVEEINDSITLAKFAPSVCNRQAWKAHFYTDKALMRELLNIQNGNGGFTDSINCLIIVTGDIKGFSKYESNQLFVDGGLFSMNLMLALHYNGLGSCPLNTCFPYIIESKVKKIANIPKNERLIMMLAVGHLKDNFKVAVSERKSNEKILKVH